MPTTVVVGGFFGDEGKGKIISHLVLADSPHIVVRGGAGPNAGHTIKHEGRTFKVRMLPSGFLNKSSDIMIGPGVVVDPDVLFKEIASIGAEDRTYIDANCGIIEDVHKSKDTQGQLKEKIGSTGSGTGPANAARAMRVLKMAEQFEPLKKYIIDVPARINKSLDKNENVLVEGTQGTFLSLWHGTYPYVTSKDVTASGICADVGIGPTRVDEVMVIFKSYVTRVGTGPLEGELSEEEISKRRWGEFGTVTGRARRAAEFNFDLAKRAVMLNGATQIAITKMDVLFPECAHINDYASMPQSVKNFIENIEEKLRVPVTLVGTGPSSIDIVDRRDTL
ncbi:MAG: Adenylosuccinate synthetase [Cenarchaeum symbiont of Oopsacas minuta]|nr:Adenylosuccinate synthetase [Cenarchaeum symbiont of Oopsacas minuta]